MNKKISIVLVLLLTLSLGAKAYAALTLGSTSVSSNGALTLTTSSSTLVLPTTNGTNGQVLTTNGSGITSWTTVAGGGGGGLTCSSCTTNTVPIFDGTNLADSRISDDGSVIQIGSTSGGLQFNAGNTAFLGDADNFHAIVRVDPGSTSISAITDAESLAIDGSAHTITATAGTESLTIDGGAHSIFLSTPGAFLAPPSGLFIEGGSQHIALQTADVLDLKGGSTLISMGSGDTISASAASAINLDSQGGVTTIGDVNGIGNSTALAMDDTNKTINLITKNSVNNKRIGLLVDGINAITRIDGQTGIVYVGDTNFGPQAFGNDTLLTVDDANQRITFTGDGNVGIGTGTPNANAILDVTSTTKAFMPPRMTTTQRDAIASPTAGMVIYNSTTNKLNVYTTTWEAVTSS